jgi:hypothetical protein
MSLIANAPDVLYIGITNRIKLENGKPGNNYIVAVNGADSRLEKSDEYVYNIRVSKTDTCRLTIKTPDDKILLEKKYTVRTIPMFRPAFAGTIDTVISKSRILANHTFYIVIPDCFYDHNSYINSFSATFIQSSSNDSTYTRSFFNRLTEEQLKLVRELNSGDQIFLSEIYAGSPDSRRQRMPDMTIRIK